MINDMIHNHHGIVHERTMVYVRDVIRVKLCDVNNQVSGVMVTSCEFTASDAYVADEYKGLFYISSNKLDTLIRIRVWYNNFQFSMSFFSNSHEDEETLIIPYLDTIIKSVDDYV